MQTKLFLIAATVFLCSFSITSFSQKQTRNVDTFTGISLGVSADLYLTTNESQRVVLEGDEDILDRIETSVKNGRLIIKSGNNNWWKGFSGKINIYVSVRDIDYISLSGSGKIFGKNTIEGDRLKLSVSGSGDMRLQINVDELDQGISGSGDLELRGKVRDVSTTVSGSGSLDAEELVADSHEIRISGSGKCRIHAEKEIDARISGSGSIYYKGDPNIRSATSGSGKIRPL
ncbi:head GIN domain-containing protein [Bacteroidota bacterium]